MGFSSENRLCKEFNFGPVLRLVAPDLNFATQFNPRSWHDGAAVGTGKCDNVVLVEFVQSDSARADMVHTDGEAKEWGASVDETIEWDAGLRLFRVEGRNGWMMADLFRDESDL